MKLRRIPASTSALALLNGAFVALALLIWHTGQQSVEAPMRLPVRRIALPDLSALSVAPAQIVDTAAIRDDAVFHNRRSFFQPPPPSQALSRPDYDFAGTMGLPEGKRVAFVKRKSDQSTRSLHLGDDIEGWRVASIEVNRVTLAHDNEQYELTSVVANAGLGLSRSAGTANVAQSNLHALDGQGSASGRRSLNAESVRTYRPPPH